MVAPLPWPVTFVARASPIHHVAAALEVGHLVLMAVGERLRDLAEVVAKGWPYGDRLPA